MNQQQHDSKKEADEAFRQLDQRLRREGLVPTKTERFTRRYWIAAATLLVGLLSAALFSAWWADGTPTAAVSQVEKVTLPGQKIRFQLPDGTKVWLNADSRFTYPSTFTEQRVVYLSGEAFLEVAHDADRLFTVRTEDATVQVIGTSFNVKARQTEPTEAVVVSGEVAFGPTDKSTSGVVLHPNNKAVLNTTTGQSVRSIVNASKYTAWTNGTLIFEDKPLGDVFTELARWYGVTVTVKDSAIQRCRVTAKFEDLPLATVLDQLQFVVPIRYQLKGKQVLIEGESCEKETL